MMDQMEYYCVIQILVVKIEEDLEEAFTHLK